MKQYDNKKVQVIVGVKVMGGFQKDSKIEVSRNADNFEMEIGNDGEGTINYLNDKSGSYKFVLQSASESNAYLSSLAIADEAGGNITVPVMVKDGSGLSLHFSEQAKIRKMPDASYGMKADGVAWELISDVVTMFHGGN